jgi:(S)-ureidoglycine aminohydrolase
MTHRGFLGASYALITLDNHYRSRLPAFPGVTVVKLVTPRMQPARFAETLVMGPDDGDSSGPLGEAFEHFLYGLAGASVVTDGQQTFALGTRGFAYLPPATRFALHLSPGDRLLWIKRRYEPLAGMAAPAANGGHAEAVSASPTATAGLTRRELIDPDDPAHDFNMSLMCFDADVALPQIEIHDEEHGLWMIAGGGVYHLAGEEHGVRTGDFIYMSPYCPQGFRAGADGAEYLLYKDVFRDGF